MKPIESFGELKMIELTDEQNQLVDNIIKDVKVRKNVKMGGFGGVGKTTVVNHLVNNVFPTFATCAYTGQAANVLRRKGVTGASTIHGLIYEPRVDHRGQVQFELRTSLPCDGIIVDEASMVGKDIYTDLLTFKIPIIFVGDHGQLEPVGSDFNVMEKPDYKLETIHRNAGEISRFAEWVRKGNNATDFLVESTGQVEFIDKMEVEERGLWTSVDQILCAFNKTRVATNKIVRNRLGNSDTLLVPGDRVMCLRNNRKFGVFNGMQGIIKDHRKKYSRHTMDFESYGDNFYDVPYEPKQFNLEKTIPIESKDDPIPFDYAYCATAHKFQGSEADTVMVFEQKCKMWSHIRWAYTVASRAKIKVLWVTGM